MLNRTLCLFVSFSIALCCVLIDASAAEVYVSAKSAILMNAQTKEIVYEKNAYEKRGMASTTKILTSLIALEYGDLSEELTVREEDVRIEGTSIGLKAGDKITLETLVAGMLLESGNDAANATATFIGGSKSKFSDLMNKKAKDIGMKNSSFKNPSGLTEEGHFSTAYDMALLACYAIKNTDFCNICSKKSTSVIYGNPAYKRTFKNHNKLLDSVDGVFGIKTGFTKASGRCLVSAAQRNGVTLVAVTLNAPNDWEDHKKMYEYGFDKVNVYNVDFDEEELEIDVVGSDKKQINVKVKTPLKYTAVSRSDDIKTVVFCEPFLYAGIKKGNRVGKVAVYNSLGEVLCESTLISAEDAPLSFAEKEKPLTVWDKIINFLERE